MKKTACVILAFVFAIGFSIIGMAVNDGIDGQPIIDSAPKGWLLQDFESVALGDFNGLGIGEVNPGTYTPAFEEAKIVSTASPNGGFGDKALKLKNGTEDGVQLCYVWIRQEKVDWSRFAQDYNNDGKIDGYFGFYMDGLTKDVMFDVVFTTAGNKIWWLSTTDTEAVMYTNWGAATGKKMVKASGLGGSYNFPAGGEYFMIKLDPDNFAGTGEDGEKINFAEMSNVMIRITNSSSSYGNEIIIDNVFVGLNPALLPVDVEGEDYYNDMTKFALNGDLVTTLMDNTPPTMDFTANPVPETAFLGSEITLPIPVVTDNLYGDDVELTISVEDPEGEAVTVTDNKFTATAEGVYVVNYLAKDGHNNEALESFVIVVSKEEEGGSSSDTTSQPVNDGDDDDDDNADTGDSGLIFMALAALALVSTVVMLRRRSEQ